MSELWAKVDSYFGDLLAPEDAFLRAIHEANQQAGLPSIDVPALLGKFLDLMVRISATRRALEIGTLGGYSTLWIARALPTGGRLLTLELDPRHAETARTNLDRAGVLDRVEIRVGKAADTLRSLVESGVEPFGLIFLDADKRGLPEYLEWSLKLSRPGTVIIADNVVRDGKVIEPGHPDPDGQGVRRLTEMMAHDPRLSATAIPMVGARGYDGFSMAVVLG